jgi:hypothetical protein
MIESHPARSPVASVRVVTPNCPPGVAPAPGAVGETVSGSVVAAPPAETATVQIGHKTGKSNMDIKDRGGPQKRGQS